MWYVRPSEIKKQDRARTPTLLHSSEGAAAAAAAAANSPAQPAVHGGFTPRRQFSKSVGNAAAIATFSDRDAHRGSLLGVPVDARPAAQPLSLHPSTSPTTAASSLPAVDLTSGDTALSEPERMTNAAFVGSAVAAPVGRVRASTVAVTSSTAAPVARAVAPAPAAKSSLLTLDIDQYDGSVSSKIVDKARSPPPILHHKSGERNRIPHGRTGSAEVASPLSECSERNDEEDGRSDNERSPANAETGADGCTEDVPQEEDAIGETELGAATACDVERLSGDHNDDDANPSTESGMTTAEIHSLLSRMGGAPASPNHAAAAAAAAVAATATAATAAKTAPSPARPAQPGKLRGILVVRRRSSASRLAAAGTAASASASAPSSASSSNSSRPARRPRSKQVSFNSCVRIREHGRIQGGSTSVTRSGAYSLGLDWAVLRECTVPLEMSIDTVDIRRRTRESRAASEPDAGAEAGAAHPPFLDVLDEDEVLLTEPDDAADADMGAEADGPGADADAHSPGVLGDVSVERYLSQELRVHRRYPSNNKDEELQRIGESARLEILRRFASPAPAAGATIPEEEEGEEDGSDSPSAAAAAGDETLSSVLSDWDEGAELEEIRESRSGNFCSCHPPRGRIRAMMMDLSDSIQGALPLSADNICCNDDSCACFRAGVGCHVENDHYCLCAGSFVEMAPPPPRPDGWTDEDEAAEQERLEAEAEAEDDDDDDNPRPLPLVQAGCLNPAGRYQFDERAGREHAQQYLYGPDPYEQFLLGPDGQPVPLGGQPLVSPPIRFARARTPSALTSFFPRTPVHATADDGHEQKEANDAAAKAGRPAFKPKLTTLTEG